MKNIKRFALMSAAAFVTSYAIAETKSTSLLLSGDAPAPTVNVAIKTTVGDDFTGTQDLQEITSAGKTIAFKLLLSHANSATGVGLTIENEYAGNDYVVEYRVGAGEYAPLSATASPVGSITGFSGSGYFTATGLVGLAENGTAVTVRVKSDANTNEAYADKIIITATNN